MTSRRAVQQTPSQPGLAASEWADAADAAVGAADSGLKAARGALCTQRGWLRERAVKNKDPLNEMCVSEADNYLIRVMVTVCKLG